MQSLPKIIAASTALVAILGYVYVTPAALTVKDQMKNIENLADGIFTFLEMIDGTSLKRLLIGIAIFIPVFVEMLAISFLSRLVGESYGGWTKVGLCWIAMAVQIIILLPLHFDLTHSSNVQNMSDTRNVGILKGWGNGRYPIWRLTLIKKSSTTLFDCRLHAWIYLYAMALLTTIIQVERNQIHRPVLLAGPFALATGTFLILSRSEENEGDLLANIMRRVLRRTLRDILMQVGEDVAEDEMLRLAMIRWIVDYWATDDSKKDSMNKRKNKDTNSDNANTEQSLPVSLDRVQNSATKALSTHADKTTFPPTESMNLSSSTAKPESSSEGIGWSQLLGMLSLSTEQMHQEIRNPNSGPGNQSNRTQQYSNGSIQSLQTLLSSFSQNERAKPAVESYKKAIADISPSRNLAIYAGLATRCPAFLSTTYLSLSMSMNGYQWILVLLPLILFEAMRVSEWIIDCRFRLRNQDSSIAENADGESWISSLFPREMTPMEIILSQDNYTPDTPGKLLQVWVNLESSVNALESGLTAMKCVDTAQIATKVAFNVMSLTMFGVEMKGKGLGAGLRLILNDIFHFHYQKCQSTAGESNFHHGQRNDIRGRHTAAVLDVVEKSQVLTKNVSELVEDSKDEGNLLSPLVTAFGNSFTCRKASSDTETTELNRTKSLSPAADQAANLKTEENHNASNTMENREVEIEQLMPVVKRVQLSSTTRFVSQLSSEGRTHTPILPQDLEFEDGESDDRSRCSVKSDAIEISGLDSEDSSWIAIGEEMSAPSAEEAPMPRVIDTSFLAGHKINFEDDERSALKFQTNAERHEVVTSDQNDVLKWVGAGMAILGTVIGGIALTTNKDNNHRGDDGDFSRSRKATVTIECLDDDDE